MLQNEPPASPDWSLRSRGVSVALWTSFLVAGLETMIVFAFLDPATLNFEGFAPPFIAMRPVLYAGGFFFLWLFAFAGTVLTAYMLEPAPRATRAPAGRPSADP